MKLLRLAGHLWSLPNTLIGLSFGLGGWVRWASAERVFVIRGGWMVACFHRLGYAGMCVGDVVLCPYELPDYIYRHEIVHAIQARILGPLYLPLTLLGYLYGFLRFRESPHDASPLETWADVASGNARHNAFLNRNTKPKK